MNVLAVINLVLIAFIIGYALYQLFLYFERKNAAKVLTPEEFRQDMRRAQIIDVREANEFKASHILGARNIPYSVLKQRYPEIRKDQPIYLYDQGSLFSGRTAAFLKKKGYRDIFILKGGYDKWDGKIKKGY